MKYRINRLLLLVMLGLAMLTGPRSAMAWGELGHQLVCDIAWREMSNASKDKIKQLLKGSSYKTFASACNWPDHVRSQDRYDWLKPYHYMNVSREASTVTEADCPRKGCVLSGIRFFSKAYKQSHSTRKQRENLFLVSHLIGDMHQPLHVSHADDLGGNRLQVYFMGKEPSLHRLMDTDILRYKYAPDYYLGNGRKPDWRKIGKQLHTKLHEQLRGQIQTRESASTGVFAQREPLAWANESYELTREIYRTLPDNRRLGEDYAETYFPVLEQRISQAGIRLARHLDDLLTSAPQN